MDTVLVLYGIEPVQCPELDLNKDDLQFMSEHLRTGIDEKNSRFN